MAYNYNEKFKIINWVCFNCKIPEIKIKVVKKWPKGTDKRTLGQTHTDDDKRKIIKIVLLKCKNKGDMTITLMHEMLHCRYYMNRKKMNHSKEFKKREWKLAKRLIKYCPEIYGCVVN